MLWSTLVLCLLILLLGCSDDRAPSQAAPDEAGDLTPVCSDTCESLGFECGEVCGRSCGTCEAAQGDGTSCVAGQCRCTPVCAGGCGQSDGCGGTCPCPSQLSCQGCGLTLVNVALEQDRESGGSYFTLAVEAKLDDAAAPRLADFRIAADRPVELERVQATDVLGDAGKLLHRFVAGNLPYERLPDGTFRFVIESAGIKHSTIGSGRWLTLRFRADAAVAAQPVRFRLLRREQTFAPLTADAALQASAYDTPLTIEAVR